MLTGHIEDREEAILDESERAKSAHMAAVIPKPFDIDRLVTVIRRAVGQQVTSRRRLSCRRRRRKLPTAKDELEQALV